MLHQMSTHLESTELRMVITQTRLNHLEMLMHDARTEFGCNESMNLIELVDQIADSSIESFFDVQEYKISIIASGIFSP